MECMIQHQPFHLGVVASPPEFPGDKGITYFHFALRRSVIVVSGASNDSSRKISETLRADIAAVPDAVPRAWDHPQRDTSLQNLPRPAGEAAPANRSESVEDQNPSTDFPIEIK